MTNEGIERILAANPIEQVLAEGGIELRRKGKTLMGLCPFHKDTDPSMSVSRGKGLYHCFSCGESGNVIGFVMKRNNLRFPEALEWLARRATLDSKALMEPRPRVVRMPREALTPPAELVGAIGAQRAGAAQAAAAVLAQGSAPPPVELLARVVDLYHKTLCERPDAQAFMAERRGIADRDLWRVLKLGYADGSLLKLVGKDSELRAGLIALGVITKQGRELLGGCVVVPLPDPLSGAFVNLYGRGMKVNRHCYLPGPLSRAVLNYQAAGSSQDVILTESVLDALSFLQVGIFTAIPLFGTSGFTEAHFDLLQRERVKRVILALDNDEPGRKATEALKEKLTAAGIAVRVASLPAGIKDPNELLLSRNGDASEVFRAILEAAEPREAPASPPATSTPQAREIPKAEESAEACEATSPAPATSSGAVVRQGERELVLRRDGLSYVARLQSNLLGRLRVTVKVLRGEALHADTIDLYSSRSRSEFARKLEKAFEVEAASVESALLALLREAEKLGDDEQPAAEASEAPTMSEAERAEAMGFLLDPELIEVVVKDVDLLGYVGEHSNVKLLHLIAVSRKLLSWPLSALVLSGSGAGKSEVTEVIEVLTPPEEVVLFTRLTPQSLYYVPPDFLDRKLVIIEERHGSIEADYSVRVLQSRGKLVVAVPIKDPSTGNLRTRTFEVKARAAFIEATTALTVNHENATRCFELTMDESVEQTQRIHERQRLMRTEAGLKLKQEAEVAIRKHRNAQRLLLPLRVVIPFAKQLTFPSSWMRTRRDHARFLNLIEVSAFLHQYQRPRTESGAIVATVKDYAIAYELAKGVLSETLNDLRKPLREAYQRISELCGKGEGSVSRREIREALHQADSTARGWLCDLVELEYLAPVEGGGRGKAVRYVVTARGPKQDLSLGLLSPEELEGRLERG